MPSYKTAFGSFLRNEDLQGKSVPVVVSAVVLDEIKDNDTSKTEKKLVMHFAGKEKALILNRTNCEAMEAMTGTDDYGSWVGHRVVLYTDPTVKFGGKTVGGLRIRSAQATAAPPPPPVPAVEVWDDGNGDITF